MIQTPITTAAPYEEADTISEFVTIPGWLSNLTHKQERAIEWLMQRFGNARRRAYRLKSQGYSKALIRRILQKETCLNARYSNDAIYSVESLPSYGVTFGGKKNQRLRMKGKISREEYIKRRNCLLISRGDKAKKGNLNLRVVNDNHRLKLRISIGTKKWIYPDLTIPAKYYRKYGNLLDGTKPYLVQIKRRNDSREYDVLITVEAHCQIKRWKRVMALDINSGHIDFAVLDEELRLIQVGRFSCFALLYASSNKRMFFLYKLAKRITKIAKHFDALVIVGKLNTGRFRSWNRRANRMIKQMPQYKFRKILKHKLTLSGIPVEERSEAYTSKIGRKLSSQIGVDIHKAAAIIFALKFLDYQKFLSLRSSLYDEKLSLGFYTQDDGNGNLSGRLKVRSGLTALHQTQSLVNNEFTNEGGYSAIPGSWGLSCFAESLKPNLMNKIVKIGIC